MDPRTIGQILSNPDWLRQTYGEERPIQQLPAGGAGPEYQQAALPPHPSTLAPPAYPYQPAAPAQAQSVAARPDSPLVEVRGTIAYVARYRAEYFNDNDQPTMMLLAQNVIMNQTGAEPGEDPPPWFPDVQFWIQSFERIDPYANAQQAELERLRLLKLEQEHQARERKVERDEQLRRERLLYGEPGTFSREGSLTGLAVEPARENGWGPGPIPGSAGPDWIGDIFRDIFERLDRIGERLETLDRGDGGAGGAGAALHPDQRDDDDADHRRREPEARRDDRPDAGDRGIAAAHAVDPADVAANSPDHDDGDLPAESGRTDAAAGPGYVARGSKRTAVAKGS